MISPVSTSVGGAGPVATVVPAVSTVVLVMTDVAGSTRLWADHPAAMNVAMARHHQLVHAAIAGHGGWRPIDQGEGDAVFAAFDSAQAAVAAVVEFQQALAAERWPDGVEIRIRVGVHAGEVISRGGNLFGSTVNRCARLRGLGAGGQVLISAPVFELVRDVLPDGVGTVDLGEHRMKDLTRPERVHQLLIPGLRPVFGPLASLDRASHNLPVQPSSFLGRSREITELVDLVRRERLVTIVGFGGMGKTRLALQVAAELADGTGDGVWFVDLAAVTDPDGVASAIAATLGISEGGDGPLSAVLAGVPGKRLLLVLDNFEQLLPAAALFVDQLRRAGPDLRILVTSREPLRLRGEYEYAIASLPVPPTPRQGVALTEAELSSVSTYEAVTLFITRAAAVRRDFALTPTNAAAIAAICTRLDGMPLALELAAARTRVLSPEALLPRLDHALRLLVGGSRDLPTRHQTLRATIAYSYDTLDRDQQHLLDRLSVFPGTFTLDAADHICGPGLTPDDDHLDVLAGVEALIDHSLLRHIPATTAQRDDRYSLLVSIRDYAAEQLDSAGHTVAVATRHAMYYADRTNPPAGYSREEFSTTFRAAYEDMHNLRLALAHARETGDDEQEITLVSNMIQPLRNQGHHQERRLIVEHAVAVGVTPRLQTVRMLVLATFAEGDNGVTDQSSAFADNTLALARELGDSSLIVVALCAVMGESRSRTRALELSREIEERMASFPEAGGDQPLWWVRWAYEGALANLIYVFPEATVEVFRRRSAEAADRPYHWAHVDCLWAFPLLGLRDEVMSTAERFEDPEELFRWEPAWQVFGTVAAARLRLLTGDLGAAAMDIGRARERLAGMGLSSTTVSTECLYAAILRADGDAAGAEQVLRRILDDPPPSADPVEVARVRWLLAVVTRENGDPVRAADLVQRAWDVVAGQDVQHLDLVLELLLERAAQLMSVDPAEAARLVGLVRTNQGRFALVDGVTYDDEAMLSDLRTRIGDAAVAQILDRTAGQPLPGSTDWSRAAPTTG